MYSSARSLAKTPGSTGDTGEVSVALRRYLADEYAFHSALAHKWLGVDAGEFGGTAKGGDAVGFLAWAKKELEDLKDGGKGIGITRGEKEKIGRSLRKGKVAEELESVNIWLKNYKKVNDTVSIILFLSPKTLANLARSTGIASFSTGTSSGRSTSAHTCWSIGCCGEDIYTAFAYFWSGFYGIHPTANRGNRLGSGREVFGTRG